MWHTVYGHWKTARKVDKRTILLVTMLLPSELVQTFVSELYYECIMSISITCSTSTCNTCRWHQSNRLYQSKPISASPNVSSPLIFRAGTSLVELCPHRPASELKGIHHSWWWFIQLKTSLSSLGGVRSPLVTSETWGFPKMASEKINPAVLLGYSCIQLQYLVLLIDGSATDTRWNHWWCVCSIFKKVKWTQSTSRATVQLFQDASWSYIYSI